MTRPTEPWDIAIIGMACRFPGARRSTRVLGQPRARRRVRSRSSRTRSCGRPARMPSSLRHPHYVKAGPILEAHDGFDAAFFGYSPREAAPDGSAASPVPRSRVGDVRGRRLRPARRQRPVGVYAGAGGLVSSYMVRLAHPDLRGQTGDLGHIGNDRDFLCSRVSFKLNLTGPSVNVQSACSTSLAGRAPGVPEPCSTARRTWRSRAASVVRVPHIRGLSGGAGHHLLARRALSRVRCAGRWHAVRQRRRRRAAQAARRGPGGR